MKPVALLIDDEVQIRRLLRVALESAGYLVCEADLGQLGLAEAALRRPDVILLDLGLPDLDGVEVLKRLREWSETPVLILSVRDAEEQKIAALDAGADDYITKPFSTAELLARLRVAQRRARPVEEAPVYTHEGLQIDLATRRVIVDGREISLTATEYALLRLLVRHAGRVLTHSLMLREIWGPNAEEHRQYLRVYVTHLRRKIEPDPQHPVHLKTESGIGYRLLSGE
jgi:two-component system, OmpR family, KDP operon response regulator KdpE